MSDSVWRPRHCQSKKHHKRGAFLWTECFEYDKTWVEYMRTKILTDKEKDQIKKISEEILEPIKGKVTFSDKPTIIHRSVSGEGGLGCVGWDEPWYAITIDAEGKPRYHHNEAFLESDDPLHVIRMAWGIAWRAFQEFGGDLNDAVAKRLWPPENGYHPDYNRYIRYVD